MHIYTVLVIYFAQTLLKHMLRTLKERTFEVVVVRHGEECRRWGSGGLAVLTGGDGGQRDHLVPVKLQCERAVYNLHNSSGDHGYTCSLHKKTMS